MGKNIKVSIIAMFLICFVGCSNVTFEKYSGENLNIGVIGEIPNVREGIIRFENIEFNDLEKDNVLSKYDAVFITEDNLLEASKKEYAHVYNECVVPFFFIESTKGSVPFINEDLSYEDVPQSSNPPAYVAGVLKDNKELSFVEYGLYNDTENAKSIEDVYSRIFTTISQNKNKQNFNL